MAAADISEIEPPEPTELWVQSGLRVDDDLSRLSLRLRVRKILRLIERV